MTESGDLHMAADGETFAGNRLLSTFPEPLRRRLLPFVEQVELAEGASLFSAGEDVAYSYFPQSPLVASLVVDLDDGRSVEVATIGFEGAVGGIVSCGHAPAYTSARVIVAGTALRVPKDRLEEAKAADGHIRNLFCRYADYLLAQVMQSVACSSYHPLEARVARWLLTVMDRSGPRVKVTQEALAGLLGAQRTTINAVAKQLQQDGLIRYSRGTLEIDDRHGLEARSCSCYDEVERFFGNMIGPGGGGAKPDASCS